MSFRSTIRSKILGLNWSKHPTKTTGPTRLLPYKSYKQPATILILTGSIGNGHLSVAYAIKDALGREFGKQIKVEVVDLMTTLESLATSATKKIYLGTLRFSPKFYELLFAHAAANEWPLKLLNTLSIPFMRKKLVQLLEEKKPTLLVSTYPVWDILIKKIWKKYNARLKKPAPFVSVLTDTGHVHPIWTMGEPDHICVPNENTKRILLRRGVSTKRIHVFGYPITPDFFKKHDPAEFRQRWGFSSGKTTLLLILSLGVRWSKIKKLVTAMERSTVKNLQLYIIACGDTAWKEKLSAMRFPWPTRITGWTNEMDAFITSSDMVLTKAGGATVMECIHSKRPMIIIETLPGQEAGNAELIAKCGLGCILTPDFSNFDEAVEYVIAHKEILQKNLEKQQKPDAGKRIAGFLAKLAGK